MDYETKKASSSSSSKLLGGPVKAVMVQIQLTKAISKPVLKPVRVKIPYSIFDAENHSICFFCRDEDKEAIEDFLIKNPIQGVNKLVTLKEVKRLYKDLKDKKRLLVEHTHFCCDARIMSHLHNALGKTFATRSNQPVPVDFGTHIEKLPTALAKYIESTYMNLKGLNISIHFGHTEMKAKHMSDNVYAGLDFAVNKLPNGWKDVHSIHLKTSDSAALPIYASALQRGRKIDDSVVSSAVAAGSLALKAANEDSKSVASSSSSSSSTPSNKKQKGAASSNSSSSSNNSNNSSSNKKKSDSSVASVKSTSSKNSTTTTNTNATTNATSSKAKKEAKASGDEEKEKKASKKRKAEDDAASTNSSKPSKSKVDVVAVVAASSNGKGKGKSKGGEGKAAATAVVVKKAKK